MENSAKKLHPEIFIDEKTKIIDALKKMDEIHRKLLIVEKNGRYDSLVTIGDIQRAILAKIHLNEPVAKILDYNKITATELSTDEEVKKYFEQYRFDFLPVVSSKNQDVIDIIFWADYFSGRTYRAIGTPVVVMAGGKGTRLSPLTNMLPKPLIPIKEKPIIVDILESFLKYNCSQYYITVNYKSDMIKAYFADKNYNIEFIDEEYPCGTAGSLAYLRGKINTPFIVTNCDIIIDYDYYDIFEYHKQHENELTIVSAVKHTSIPYGVLHTSPGGVLERIDEKPDYIMQISTGMYILEPHLLNEIPMNKVFHITDLFELVKQRSGKIGVFPISEKAWYDMGEWPELLNMYLSKAGEI